jgi:hypothetical protein
MHDINWYAVSALCEGAGLVAGIIWRVGTVAWKIHAKLDKLLSLIVAQRKELKGLRRGMHKLWDAVKELRGRVETIERTRLRGRDQIDLTQGADGVYAAKPFYSPDPAATEG